MPLSHDITITELLSSSIAPVTLITGVAFLTSIMAPRFGRCIDRIRTILIQLRQLSTESREYSNHLKQLDILYKRTRTLRNTMTAAGICIAFVVLTIATAFSHLIFKSPGTGVTITLFLLSLFWLIVLTAGFIYDFLCSLDAVKLELECGLGRRSIDALESLSGASDQSRIALSPKRGPLTTSQLTN